MTYHNFIIGYGDGQEGAYEDAVEALRPFKKASDKTVMFSLDERHLTQVGVDCSIRKKGSLRSYLEDLGLKVIVSNRLQTDEDMRQRVGNPSISLQR
ncbi:hypothetical protein CMI41_01585 [Candidatus Pacearchaeota archaeon]|jgi:hypothetical protein|nr:hypothetical protein [Candidatus Pacearchaeota archaeon]|tara:strand:- start:4999 stop:5289 length:291 start_codon:yes stop_codon:yes gene_type:complete